MDKLRRAIFGDPIPRREQAGQRLSKCKALATFSSDALSSVAYATEEIVNVLMIAGPSALGALLHVSWLIIVLMLIVGMSYRQAIAAYPRGGGAYSVSRENLGVKLSLVAASALMIDYILTVAVSISAGIRAVTSAFPSLMPESVALAVLAVMLMAWLNLRGTRESANILIWPTYLFIGFILLLILTGFIHVMIVGVTPIDYSHHTHIIASTSGGVSLILFLRAFSSGCSAMTGIEAVSNGVSAFAKPSAKNAMATLSILVGLLACLFLGISLLALYWQVQPLPNQSILSQLGHALFGNSIVYYGLQMTTCLILLVAANTSFAGFPLLASLIAEDDYLPRQLKNIGDRLAFSNGIILLALLAIALIIAFHASTHALIPLYAIGVFIAFTLCQAGLVRVWLRRRGHRWWLKALFNALGCLCTGIAVIVITESKFFEGAWLIFLAIPALLFIFHHIHQHYQTADQELLSSIDDELIQSAHVTHQAKVIVPVSKVHKGTLAALDFARCLSDDVTAIAIDTQTEKTQQLKATWAALNIPEKLVVLASPYQSVTLPLLRRIQRMDTCQPERGLTTIVVPKVLPRKWWHLMLHNHRLFLLRIGLAAMSRANNNPKAKTRVFVEVPYQLN